MTIENMRNTKTNYKRLIKSTKLVLKQSNCDIFPRIILQLNIIVLVFSMSITPAMTATLQPQDIQPIDPSPYILIQPEGTISPSRYIAGGLVGSIIGFGVGHSISHTWKNWGWLFTAADLAIAVPFIHGFTATDDTPWVGSRSYNTWIEISKYAYLPLKIVQMADLWIRPKVSRKKVRQLRTSPHTSISPWILPGLTGISVSHRF